MDRLFGYDPVISSKSSQRAAFTLDSRRSYLSTVATTSNIFALYSGRTERAFGPANVFGRDVVVFARSGRLERILRLDADVIAIASDPTGRILYGLSHDPEPRIIKFAIP